jgi:hypothetical protein
MKALSIRDVLYLAVLLSVAVLFLFPAWQQPDSFWYAPGAEFSDLTVTHWPNMWFMAQAFREHGQVPLWRPSIMGGAPFVGNPLAALFDPASWLFFLWPTTLTFHLLFAIGLFGAGATFYGLVRWSYCRSPFAAFCGGLGYMLTPKLIAHIGAGHVGLSQAFAWLPLTLWLLRDALERRRGYRAAWCGLALALVFFADPRVAFYGASLLGSYALYRTIGVWHGEGGRVALGAVLRLLLVPVTFALVGAAQILPTLELAATTTRTALTLNDAARDSLPWRYLIGYLLANRGGYHEWMTYLGLAPLGLAVLALWRSQETERWFWVGLAAVALLFSLGSNAPLYPLIYRLLPGLGWMRVPSRALLLIPLAVNLLAAWGVDGVFGREWSPRARRWATRLAFAGFLACGILGIGFALRVGENVPASIVALAAIGAGWAGVLFLSVRRRLPSLVGQTIMAALLLVDLWSMGRSLLTLRSAEEVFAEGRGVAAYLAAQEKPFRVYSPSYSVRQHVGAYLGLEQLDGVDPLQLRWTARFMALAGGYEVAGYGVTIPFFPDGVDIHVAWRDVLPDAALLGLLNGRFLVAAFPLPGSGDLDWELRAQVEDSYVYENRRCLPRAFTVTWAEEVADWESAQARLAAGFDPAKGALVEGGPGLDGPPGWQEAYVALFAPNRIVVEADVTQPALLVLGEVWYPGWRVEVDGVERPLYRVDGIVRGTYLEPGAHVTMWAYRPASLQWGIALSLGAASCLAAGGVVAFVRQRWDRGATSSL